MRDKTNIMIVIFTLIAFGIGWLTSGMLGIGFNLGLGVFLAWAVSREIDPANIYPAFIAAALSLIDYFYTDAVQFLFMAWMLLILRLVNGITGKALTLIDIIVGLGFTIFLSINHENSLYLFIFAIASIGLYMLREQKKATLIAGSISIVAFAIETLFFGYFSLVDFNQINALMIIVVIFSILFALLSRFFNLDEAVDDKHNKADHRKIIFGQIVYSLSLILFVFFSDLNTGDFVIQLAVMTGSFLYFIGEKGLNFFKRN